MAQFRVLPYFAREKIALPGKLLNWLAVAPETLQKLLDAEEPEDDAPGEVVDLSMGQHRAGYLGMIRMPRLSQIRDDYGRAG